MQLTVDDKLGEQLKPGSDLRLEQIGELRVSRSRDLNADHVTT